MKLPSSTSFSMFKIIWTPVSRQKCKNLDIFSGLSTFKTIFWVQDGPTWGRLIMNLGLRCMPIDFKVRYWVMEAWISWFTQILEFYASSIHFINFVFIIITASDTRAPPHGPIRGRYFESSLLLFEVDLVLSALLHHLRSTSDWWNDDFDDWRFY